MINIALLGGDDTAVMAGVGLARQGHRVACVELPSAAGGAGVSARLPVWSGAASGYLTFTRNPAMLGRSQLIVVGAEAPAACLDAARLLGCHLYSDTRIIFPTALAERDLVRCGEVIATILAYRDLALDFSLQRQSLADLARHCVPAPDCDAGWLAAPLPTATRGYSPTVG